MSLKDMFKKRTLSPQEVKQAERVRKAKDTLLEFQAPEGLFQKCNCCGKPVYNEDLIENDYVCPVCGSYFRIRPKTRIAMVLDKDTFEEWDAKMDTSDPLNFPGYKNKLERQRSVTNLDEAVVTGKGKILGKDVVIAVMGADFMMGSMGEVVGEKITRAVERATQMRLPIIIFTCSGGARMQEGIVSLMQMAKTSAALKRHDEAGLLYITVLTDPTTGGVTASFAMLGDVILAEPGALIGFAGPRVIEQTIGQKLPEGFQRAEFLVEHGFVDDIVRRENLKETLGKILEIHAVSWKTENRIRTDAAELHHADYPGSDSENLTNDKCDSDRGDSNPAGINPYLTAWDRVQISRKIDRPSGSDYIEALFTDFMEFHGDRNYGDDKAIIGGIAKFHGKPVTVIVQEKGTNTKENIAHNFGMPMPEGYRKALRLMKQAEKFHRPVICFVDTPGAFCGIEAEERGQGEAIARNLWELAGLKTPVLSIVTGEGGSGGALALAAGDQVWMLENSIYSILSPEGFASILWKDSTKAKEAAGVMKLTAGDLYEKGIIEQVIPEPENLTPESMWQVAERLNDKICTFLQKYTSLSEEELLETRYARFRKF
jgi:acetyl-CoA carboxylase carboxyl transferase subunit beta